MTQPEPFVDIHCHLLPHLDDGAKSWEESVAMARMAVGDGIGTIVATPHQLGNHSHNSAEMIRARVGQITNVLAEQQVPLTVLPGADVRIEPDLPEKIRQDHVLTLADRGKHVLLELPHEMYLPFEGLLDSLRRQGIVGILSHPERNQGLLRQPRLVDTLIDHQCLMQVTAGSLAGSFGPDCQHFAERMVERGQVHFLATDAHGQNSRRPLMQRSFERVVELAGEKAAIEICCTNPQRVVAGEDVPQVVSKTKRSGFVGWLRTRRAG